MKNKLIISSFIFCLSTTLNAGSFFASDTDNYYKQFHDDIEKFFDNGSFFTAPYDHYRINLSKSYPKMNVFENKELYTFEYELVGINKKDIKVEITNQNILTVSGKKEELTKEEKKDMIRQERFYGSFSRSISLPDDINKDKIKITYKEGILKIVISKDTKKIDKSTRILSIE